MKKCQPGRLCTYAPMCLYREKLLKTNTDRTMKAWIYRLQNYLAITKGESTALAVVVTMFVTGLLLQHLRPQPPVPANTYAAVDSVFNARSQQTDSQQLVTAAAFMPDTSDTLEPKEPKEAVRMNLNTATGRQLQQLSGVGPVLAQRILAYRKQNGAFVRVDELMEVSGIGPKTLDSIKPLLFVPESADTSVGKIP